MSRTKNAFLDVIEKCFREIYPVKSGVHLDKKAVSKTQKYCLDLIKYIIIKTPTIASKNLVEYKKGVLLPILKTQNSRVVLKTKEVTNLYPTLPLAHVKLLLLIVRNFLKVLFKGIRNEIKDDATHINYRQIRNAYKHYRLSKIYTLVYGRSKKIEKSKISSLVQNNVAILKKQGIKLLKFSGKQWVAL